MNNDKILVAGIQTNPIIGDIEENLLRVEYWLKESKKIDAQLVVFPECALTGYCFSSVDEAIQSAVSVPGPHINSIQKLCKDLNLITVIGTLEKEKGNLYNSAVILSGDGIIGKYRKMHLPFLGVDKFVTPGNKPFSPYTTTLSQIGVLICYDFRFPEPARILSLKGVPLITLPTNWPVGGEIHPDFIVRTRACENHIFVIAVNRCGNERNTRFIGRSQIIAPNGSILVEASGDKEQIIASHIELNIAMNKHLIIEPGEFEMDLTRDRRPDFYKELVD